MSRFSSYSAMKPSAITPAAQFLSTTWHALRVNHDLPPRRYFTPRLMAAYLPDIFILHHRGKSGIQFRLAGTRLCARHGQELRHKLFSDLWPTNHQVNTEEMLHSIANHNIALCAHLSGISHMQRQNDFELIILPVQHYEEIQWIGAVIAHHDSYWLEADPINHYQIIRSFPITQDNLQVTTAQFNAAHAFKKINNRKTSIKRPAFRIIQGGKP